jgi:outer membrane protein assembly factor BamB
MIVVNNHKQESVVECQLREEYLLSLKKGGDIYYLRMFGNKAIYWSGTYFVLIDIKEKKIDWECESDNYIGMPISIENNLIFAIVDNSPACLELETGNIAWQIVPSVRENIIACNHEYLLCSDKSKRPNPVICRLKKTGEIVWAFNEVQQFTSNIVIVGDLIILDNYKGYQVLDISTGKLKWSCSLSKLVNNHFKELVEEDYSSHLGPIVDGIAYCSFCSYKGGYIFAIEVKSGSMLWVYKHEHDALSPGSILYDNGKIYFNLEQGYSYENYLTCVDAETGKKIFQTEDNFTPQGCENPIITNGFLIGGKKEYLSFFDLKKQKFVWCYEDKEKRNIFGRQLYSYKNMLITLGGDNKEIYWFCNA